MFIRGLQAGKTAVTIDGNEVVIYCTDAPGSYPIHGRFVGRNNEVAAWTRDGRWSSAVTFREDGSPHPLNLSANQGAVSGWL
jgi:hypothetical protein